MLLKNATKQMEKIAKDLDIPKDRQVIKFGPAKFVILEEKQGLNYFSKLKKDIQKVI